MSNRTIKLLAAAAMTVATPALASAQSIAYSTSPVSVTSCNVIESSAPELPFTEGAQQFTTSGIALSFVNKSDVSATTVKFVLNDGRYTQNLLDKGIFAPGVQIEHSFAADTGTNARRDATCSVAEVEFADGSVWHSGSPNVAER